MDIDFNPLVSIIIPIYNGANYMREAIDSALAQTYKNIEVVVINDGSTDNTEEIAKSYGDRIRYFPKENGGVATALNMGIRESKGEYISWLSHDDIYYPDKVEKQINEFNKGTTKDTIIYGNYDCIDERGNFLYCVDLNKNHAIAKLDYGLYAVLRGCLHGCTMLIPKDKFEKIGFFDEKLYTTQDYDLWFKFFKNNSPIRYLDYEFVASRIHKNQTSKTSNITIEECDKLWIGMLSSLTNEEMMNVDGKVAVFLERTLPVLKENRYQKAVDYTTKILNATRDNTSEVVENPKISIIIPCYNQGGYIERAVDSVFDQKYENIEIIIINDGSTDKYTNDLLNNFARERVTVYVVENMGRSAARNFGISKASGDYIQFLDADDIILPNKLIKQTIYFKNNPEVDIVYCGFYYLFDVKQAKKFPRKDSLTLNVANVYEDLLFKWQRPISIPIHTYLFKKDCFNTLKFIENIDVAEDWIMWISLARENFIFNYMDFIGVAYRIHENNTSRNGNTSFYHAILAISFIRGNLVDKRIQVKFDVSMAEYLQLLSGILLVNKNNKFLKIRNNIILTKDKVKSILKNTYKKIFPKRLRKSVRNILVKIFNKIKSFCGMLFDSNKVSSGKVTGNIDAYNGNNIKKYKCDIEKFFNEVKKDIIKSDVVLDIGCGIRPQTFFEPKVHVCVEPFAQYRQIIKPFFPNHSYVIFLREDALKSLQVMDDNSVDSVFMIDIIEHLEKKDGFLLIKEAERVSRKQVIIFTPLGFYPMHFNESRQTDAWGLNGNDVQEHKSGWLPEDFGDSWDFYICEDCHEAFLSEEIAIGKKYSGLMAIKTKNFNGFEIMDETPEFVKDVYKERILKGNN